MTESYLAKKKLEFISQNFSNVNKDDVMVADYSCSLQRDALIQGRIYLTYYGYYFHSKILGFITTTSKQWLEVIELRKDKAAFVLPVLLNVSTKTEKQTFSFLQNRNKAFSIMRLLWRNLQESTSQATEPNALNINIAFVERIREHDFCDEPPMESDVSCDNLDYSRAWLKAIEKSNNSVQKPSCSAPALLRNGSLEAITKPIDINGGCIELAPALDNNICVCANDSFEKIAFRRLYSDLETVKFFMFHEKSPLFPQLAEALDLNDMRIVSNSVDQNGHQGTVLAYTCPVGFPFPPIATETFQELRPSDIWNCDHCTVYSTSCSQNSVYSDSFRAHLHYCFLRQQDSLLLTVYFKIEYIKNISTIVKSLINGRSYAKAREYVLALLDLLENRLTSDKSANELSVIKNCELKQPEQEFFDVPIIRRERQQSYLNRLLSQFSYTLFHIFSIIFLFICQIDFMCINFIFSSVLFGAFIYVFRRQNQTLQQYLEMFESNLHSIQLHIERIEFLSSQRNISSPPSL